MANNESVGLLKLWEPQNPAGATVDIVFIHGLGGDRKNTWTYTSTEGPTNFWPEELLPEKCPTARILTFGYNAQFIHFYFSKKQVPIGTKIDDHSSLLLQSLANLRSETQSTTRPIIFVAHSLGGLVCAYALSHSSAADEATKLIAEHTCGTVFLGTPFEGSLKAKPGQTILRMAKWLGVNTNTKDVEELSKDAEKLGDIRTAFLKVLKDRDVAGKPIHVTCYFETSPTYILDNKKWVPVGVIVERNSATLPPFDPVPISANHKSICKFAGEWESGFQTVSGLLARLIDDLSKRSQPNKQNRGVSVEGDVTHGGENFGGQQFGHLVATERDGIRITGPSHHSFTFGGPKPRTGQNAYGGDN